MMELDGEPVPADVVAGLAVNNYGHFTSMLVDDLRVKGLQLHLDRLTRDSRLLFGVTPDQDWIRYLLRRVAARCSEPTMVRATVFDPAAGPGAAPAVDVRATTSRPRVLVTTRPTPLTRHSAGLRVRTVDYVRDLPQIKHIGVFGAGHQRRLAQRAGFDDALFVSPAGLVCEGSTWNVMARIGSELVLPDGCCLPGITRQLLSDVLDRAGAAWSARSIDRAELGELQAAFATSSGAGVRPIVQIDGTSYPGDPAVLSLLRTGYARLPRDTI